MGQPLDAFLKALSYICIFTLNLGMTPGKVLGWNPIARTENFNPCISQIMVAHFPMHSHRLTNSKSGNAQNVISYRPTICCETQSTHVKLYFTDSRLAAPLIGVSKTNTKQWSQKRTHVPWNIRVCPGVLSHGMCAISSIYEWEKLNWLFGSNLKLNFLSLLSFNSWCYFLPPLSLYNVPSVSRQISILRAFHGIRCCDQCMGWRLSFITSAGLGGGIIFLCTGDVPLPRVCFSVSAWEEYVFHSFCLGSVVFSASTVWQGLECGLLPCDYTPIAVASLCTINRCLGRVPCDMHTHICSI